MFSLSSVFLSPLKDSKTVAKKQKSLICILFGELPTFHYYHPSLALENIPNRVTKFCYPTNFWELSKSFLKIIPQQKC